MRHFHTFGYISFWRMRTTKKLSIGNLLLGGRSCTDLPSFTAPAMPETSAVWKRFSCSKLIAETKGTKKKKEKMVLHQSPELVRPCWTRGWGLAPVGVGEFVNREKLKVEKKKQVPEIDEKKTGFLATTQQVRTSKQLPPHVVFWRFSGWIRTRLPPEPKNSIVKSCSQRNNSNKEKNYEKNL